MTDISLLKFVRNLHNFIKRFGKKLLRTENIFNELHPGSLDLLQANLSWPTFF